MYKGKLKIEKNEDMIEWTDRHGWELLDEMEDLRMWIMVGDDEPSETAWMIVKKYYDVSDVIAQHIVTVLLDLVMQFYEFYSKTHARPSFRDIEMNFDSVCLSAKYICEQTK